ncbi:MAG TPA: hypothetical protein VJU78_10565, partial [Chitinophagaceae bacterium]|nr:hypothetical protein [Chitinophagaceae bacterium]
LRSFMPFSAFATKTPTQKVSFFSIFFLLLYISSTSFENNSPSPDGRENPFVPGFGTKDWKDSGKQLLIKK